MEIIDAGDFDDLSANGSSSTAQLVEIVEVHPLRCGNNAAKHIVCDHPPASGLGSHELEYVAQTRCRCGASGMRRPGGADGGSARTAGTEFVLHTVTHRTYHRTPHERRKAGDVVEGVRVDRYRAC